jgi:hypothetical protein
MSASAYGPQDRQDHDERLVEALREQGATPAEIAEWAPTAARLGEWPEHAITPADTQRLLAALAPLVPTSSPVRQAVRERFARRRSGLAWLLDTARTQVSILRPSFWLLSAAIALLGAYVEVAPWDGDAVLLVRAAAPLLAFLGIVAIFRGMGLRMIECEIGCPPSALELTIARLVVVLGYDIGLGLCLGVGLWLRGGHGAPGEMSFLALTLHWLTPLLLVAGLALMLSLRLPIALASGIAYGCWLAGLSLYYSIASSMERVGQYAPAPPPTLPIGVELALGLAGLALLSVGTWRLPANISRMLPIV